MQFEIEKNEKGQYYWRLRAANNQIIAWSGESYVNKSDCERGIRLVKSTDASTPVVDKTVASVRW